MLGPGHKAMLQLLVAGLGMNSFGHVDPASGRCSDPAGEEEQRISYTCHWHTGMHEPPAMALCVTQLTGNRVPQKHSKRSEAFSSCVCKI